MRPVAPRRSSGRGDSEGRGAEPKRPDTVPEPRRDRRAVLRRILQDVEGTARRRGSRGLSTAVRSMLPGRGDDAVRRLHVARYDGSLGSVQQHFPVFRAAASTRAVRCTAGEVPRSRECFHGRADPHRY
jgi:hypothetical protein